MITHSQNSLWANSYFPSNKYGLKMVWRWLEDSGAFTITIESSKAHLCPCVWWGAFGARRPTPALPSSRAGVTHSSLHSSVCPLPKHNCQPSSLEQCLHTGGPLKACEVPPNPRETIRQGRWAAHCKRPPEKTKVHAVSPEYQSHFLKWLQTRCRSCSFEVEYIKFL